MACMDTYEAAQLIRQVVNRVEVDSYPKGFPQSTQRRKEEGQAFFEEGWRKHHWAVMDERVCIIPN